MTDFPTHDPDATTLYSMIRMTGLVMVQVPTADMLVSTTLLIVMSTIWIQEQQQIFVSYSCYIIHFFQFLPLNEGFANIQKTFLGVGFFV
jgi:hypothetical protein